MTQFEKTALTLRALETFNQQKKDMFNRTVRNAQSDSRFKIGSKDKVQGRLAEYQKDIEASDTLITELRRELSGMTGEKSARAEQ